MHHSIRAAFGAALCLLSLGLPASAQDVSLRSLDGSVEISGALIGFDGEFYRIDSIYGPLTVSAQGVSCQGPGCPDLENYVAELRLTGARAIADILLPALIESFARDSGMQVRRDVVDDHQSAFVLIRPADGSLAARFTVAGTSSADGFAALLNHSADIALSVREPSQMERDAAGEGLTSRGRVIGLDALVPIVSPSNPVDALSLLDLADLYSGDTVTWARFGGPDGAVSLHLLTSTSGLSQSFASRVLLPAEAGLVARITRHEDPRDLADAVARDPFAIGITSFSATGNARALPLRGNCSFTQVASDDSLKTEDYPLTAPLFLFLPERRLPQFAREFLTFLESQTADRVVRRSNFVNQAITEIPLAQQGQRLANAVMAAGEETTLGDLQGLLAGLAGANRLSPTFRFAGGETRLDAQSRASVDRLARAIERGLYDGRELIFVGFSDSVGTAEANLRLSRERAEAARVAVTHAAAAADLNRIQMRVAAYGEALPMACDDTERDRSVNRRVEVWLR